MDANPTLKEKYVYIVLRPISKTMPTQLVGSLTSKFLCQNKLQLGTQCSCLLFTTSVRTVETSTILQQFPIKLLGALYVHFTLRTIAKIDKNTTKV